ncbi:MAG: type II toxin-antitoxin system RelE/ParE family toxin [Bacteroidales bacterium]
MEIKVFWSELALSQLEQIFDYYKYKANPAIAKKIVLEIIDRTFQLKENPLSGVKEPLLKNRQNEYRFLVNGNYKIIYSKTNNYVNISAVFDCRQNPDKLTKKIV